LVYTFLKPNNSPIQTPIEGGSLKHIPLMRNCSLTTCVPTNEKPVGNHPRHISPFMPSRSNAENPPSNQEPNRSIYFKDDSDIRKVIEKIKRNENFENGMNYLTEYLEKHPGLISST